MTDGSALLPPAADQDLRALAVAVLRAGTTVYRAHSVSNDPWWFSGTGLGRFDLPEPMGTLYVADNLETAVRERLRERVVAAGVVSPALAATFSVAKATMNSTWRCGHVSARSAARVGITRELCACPPSMYPVSQAWAVAICESGFSGIRYGARFMPGKANAWALFGTAGVSPSVANAVAEIDAAAACVKAGIAIQGPPELRSLDVIA
ncbi:MAG: RES family NAD+ phosphorylase [Propionibacteriaceae bacterium]|jgi:hypothetical protein|nr:RES family NAD+ phosphorylase [Propionibacteriaceae bacterium]